MTSRQVGGPASAKYPLRLGEAFFRQGRDWFLLAHNQRQLRIDLAFGDGQDVKIVAEGFQAVVKRHNGAADPRLHRLDNLKRRITFKDIPRR